MEIYSEKSIFKIIILIILSCLNECANGLPKLFRTNEICGLYNGHRVYLELGDRGQLRATNITIADKQLTNQTEPFHCSLELVTCPSCNFKISLSYSNFPTTCKRTTNESPPCLCDYLRFSEPPYDEDENAIKNCGQDLMYTSKTRNVMIKFIFNMNHTHAFSLEYTAERNREVLQSDPGNATDKNGFHNQVLSTPFFPSYYARDFTREHVLTCNIDQCRINVAFTDFQVAKTSIMEFYDWNGTKLKIFSGVIFRPPLIQSTGPSMIIRFFANGGTGLGYKANVTFLTIASASSPEGNASTNCGGLVQNSGGAITMMRMLNNDTDPSIYDCIWVIKPPNTYIHLKTHLLLRVDVFEKMKVGSLMIIRQGTTSVSPLLESITSNTTSNFTTKSFTVPMTTGFYISLQGVFDYESRLAIVYASFSYIDCHMSGEFLCANQKCIPIQLSCDGFDHCGDNSDEPDTCELEWESEPIDKRWYTYTPNYYFPKIDQYPDLKTATLVFMACSLGLIALIGALILMLYKSGSRARHQRELREQLQTISDLLGENNNSRADEPDEPPLYEPPPEYEEIIKVGLEDDMNRKQKKSTHGSGRKSRMGRSRRNSNNASDMQNTILEVVLPPESSDMPMPSTSTGPSRSYVDGTSRISEENDDNLMRSEPDFFITSRILDRMAPSETPTSNSDSKSYSSAGRSEPTPTPASSYDSKLTESKESLSSTSQSDIIARGYVEESSNLSLSLARSPKQSQDSITKTINHLWNNSSRNHKSWLVFSRNEPTEDVKNVSLSVSNNIPSMESVNSNQIKEIGDYLIAYQKSVSESSQSFSSSASNNFDVFLKNCPKCPKISNKQYTLCKNCIESKICSTCGGKITSSDSQQINAIIDVMPKICNCFPKISTPSKGVNLGKSISIDQIETARKKFGFSNIFGSHQGITSDSESKSEIFKLNLFRK